MTGKIIKGIAGFYYVHDGKDRIYECKAKGIFRKEKIIPLAGDWVKITVDSDEKGVIDEIFPRKNEWLRPPLANLDQLVLVVSSCEPTPNLLNLDKLLTVAEYKEIEPLIVITKVDLADGEELKRVYRSAGFTAMLINNLEKDTGKMLLPYL